MGSPHSSSNLIPPTLLLPSHYFHHSYYINMAPGITEVSSAARRLCIPCNESTELIVEHDTIMRELAPTQLMVIGKQPPSPVANDRLSRSMVWALSCDRPSTPAAGRKGKSLSTTGENKRD
jgi:hypothetical protein